MTLKVGDTAPPIPEVSFSGQWTLIYFYPKDFTPGCTVEACSFRDNYPKLSSKITILGVSSDSETSHQQFSAKYRLPFRLLSDPDKHLIKAYGADGLLFPKRTSFLINPQGVIHKIYPRVNPTTHAADILADL